MPAKFQPPFVAKPAARRPRPVALPFDGRDWNRQSLVIGIVGTVLFHLLLIFGIPNSMLRVDLTDADSSTAQDEFEINLVDEEEEPPVPRFVETNPEAPENEPDDTDAIAARNQQAANEEVPEELSPDKTPARESEDDLPTDRIVSGDLNPEISLPPSPEAAEESAAQEQINPSNPMQRNPLSGIEDDQTENEEGPGSATGKRAPDQKPLIELRDGQPEDSPDVEPQDATVQTTPTRPTPAPRPRLPRITPGPIKSQPLGVSETGRVGVNANFSQYGEYIERMLEAISQRWNINCRGRAIGGESGTHVVLEFKITPDGLVHDLELVDRTSTILGQTLCSAAIRDGQSYGNWTEDMVKVLGDEQTVTITFYYR